MLMLFILAIVQLVSPHWWLVMAIPFCFGLLNTEKKISVLFLHYFLMVFVLWAGMALYLQSTYADLVTARIQELSGIPSLWMLLAATGFTGGFAAAFSGAAGTSIRKIFVASGSSEKGHKLK